MSRKQESVPTVPTVPHGTVEALFCKKSLNKGVSANIVYQNAMWHSGTVGTLR